MEIDITDFAAAATPKDYSASAAELGQNAGQITWRAASRDSAKFNLLNTEEKRDAARKFFLASGGWSEEEVAAFDNTALNALLIQFISGNLREFQELANGDWAEWKKLSDQGTVSGALFGGSLSANGRTYYSLES